MLNRIAYSFLCVAVFAMPWEETVKIVGNSRLPALAATGACLTAVIGVAISRQLRPLAMFHAIAIAFLCWGVLSLFWSVDSANTLARSATYAQLVLLTWLVWQFTAEPARQRALLQAFVLGAFLTAGDMIRNYMHGVRYVSVEGYEHESFTSGLFRPNDVAFMLVLALPMAWYLAVRKGRGPMMWVNRLYVPVGMVGIFLTASRGALIPAIFALSIVPLTMGKMKFHSRVMTAALAVLVVPITIAVVPQTSWDRLATTKSDLESGTMTHRRDIWRAGFEVFNQHPMAGVGPGNYEIAAGAYLDRPRPAHNAFLAVLVEQGTIGLLLFCGLFVAGVTNLKFMASLERRFWIVLLFTLAIGLLPRNWDYKKPTWFVLAIFASAAASAAEAARNSAASDRRERWLAPAQRLPDRAPQPIRWGAAAELPAPSGALSS